MRMPPLLASGKSPSVKEVPLKYVYCWADLQAVLREEVDDDSTLLGAQLGLVKVAETIDTEEEELLVTYCTPATQEGSPPHRAGEHTPSRVATALTAPVHDPGEADGG